MTSNEKMTTHFEFKQRERGGGDPPSPHPANPKATIHCEAEENTREM